MAPYLLYKLYKLKLSNSVVISQSKFTVSVEREMSALRDVQAAGSVPPKHLASI
jgi:hypothetical protein